MMRAILYVDGFNIYHAVDDLRNDKLKSLSLHELGRRIIQQRSETLTNVVYFSAYADYLTPTDPDIVARHKQYVKALEATSVEVVMGNFKRKQRRCRSCQATWDSHEEKETDVNIAVRLVADAYQDKYDVAYVLSADTDLVPAMKCVRVVTVSNGMSKQIVAVFPPDRDRFVNSLRGSSDRQISLNRRHIEIARMSNVITLPDGTEIRCPGKYL